MGRPYDGSGFVGVDPWLTDADEGRRLCATEPDAGRGYRICDACARDAYLPITIAGVGTFCSPACAANGRRHGRKAARA